MKKDENKIFDFYLKHQVIFLIISTTYFIFFNCFNKDNINLNKIKGKFKINLNI